MSSFKTKMHFNNLQLSSFSHLINYSQILQQQKKKEKEKNVLSLQVLEH